MNINQIGLTLRGAVFEPGKDALPMAYPIRAAGKKAPLISCTMPTRGHLFPARFSIDCFLRQSYPNRELVIVCVDAGSEVELYVKGLNDPRISFHHVPGAKNVGDMRNFAIAKCKGTLVAVWDDDDLSAPDRLSFQYDALRASGARAAFLSRTLLWWPALSRLAITERRIWEPTMLVERAALPAYKSLERGSDSIVVEAIRKANKIALVDHPSSYCYILHGRNIWGARHFAGFFSRATRTFDDEAYGEAIGQLSSQVPISDYAVSFFQHARNQRLAKAAAPAEAVEA